MSQRRHLAARKAGQVSDLTIRVAPRRIARALQNSQTTSPIKIIANSTRCAQASRVILLQLKSPLRAAAAKTATAEITKVERTARPTITNPVATAPILNLVKASFCTTASTSIIGFS